MDKMEFIKTTEKASKRRYEEEPMHETEAKATSPIEESLEQLEKEVYRMNEYLHELFSKLKPCLNEYRIKEGHKDKKEVEPAPPKSVIREKITLIKTMIKKSTEDITIIIDSSEL